ncbi:MAG: hypothetical protein DSY88_03845, partial [Candidatus Poseidoniales archaeon]
MDEVSCPSGSVSGRVGVANITEDDSSMKRSVQAATVLRMHGARRSPVIESFNYGAQVARIVSEQHLGRTVTDRMRHARIIALGDRKSSVAQSPCL